MADIDTAAIRAVYGAEFADGTVYDLCAEVDALRDRLAEAAAELDKTIDMRDRYKAALESCEARLAEVEAERDGVYGELEMWQEKAADIQRDLSEALARLAEVEAERDEWNSNYNAALFNGKAVYDRMVWLEARLAEVERALDDGVRAAARGDGDPQTSIEIWSV